MAVRTRKLVIKPFREKPKVPTDFEDESWRKLQVAVDAIALRQPINMSREELYCIVEDLCHHNKGQGLYLRLRDACARHISRQVSELARQVSSDTVFLSAVERTWSTFTEQTLTIRSIFLYLDRSFALHNPNFAGIWECSLELFNTCLGEHGELEARITKALLRTIEDERSGASINSTLVRNVMRMLSALQIYERCFEEPFLRESRVFFSGEGSRLVEATAPAEFLVHCENRLTQAVEMATHYFAPCTRRPLLHAIEDMLIKPHTSTIVSKGFDQFQAANRTDALRRLYLLFQRVDRLEEVKAAFNAYLKRLGLELVNDDQREKVVVQEMLTLKAAADATLRSSFSESDMFRRAVKDAFEYTLNVRGNRMAELMAKFLDTKLRGEKGVSDYEVEAQLEQLMVIFRFVHAKDVFEAFYKKDLAKRLLLGKSASFDLERSMIAKLKSECGSAFTNKLEGMFKDVDLSVDLMIHYAEARADSGAEDKRDVNVQVLTTGYWPAYPPSSIVFPSDLAPHRDHFVNFYTTKYQGRRLAWQHSLEHCIVRAAFPSGRKELDVSLFQTTLLLCFNSADTLTFGDLRTRTGLEVDELSRTLQSLACGKVRVLRKEPKGREVSESDVFHYNAEFTQKLFRIRINSIQAKETSREVEKTHDSVKRDRQYSIDAAVVRIMKSRKVLSHNLLLSEAMSQLLFPTSAPDVKKRIESLIEREYIERDEDSPNTYRYLA